MKSRRPRPPGPPRSAARGGAAPPQPSSAPRAAADHEVTFGHRAGLAVIAKRPADVVEVWHAPALRGEVEPALRAASARPAKVSVASDAELARLASSTHHEGLCVIARARRWTGVAELGERLVRGKGAAIALDRVRNPYNVGAIVRTAAFFGVDAAIFGAIAPHPALAPDAIRVAEGGIEHLAIARTTDLASTLERLRASGVQVVGADGGSRTGAIGFAFARPTVLVMGHEREGLSARVRAQCDAIVAIPGTGAIESLNVGVAAGLLIGEMLRDRYLAR